MSDLTPQQEMAQRMSTMSRKRAGRLIKPTMSEMIQARKSKVEGVTNARDRTTGVQNIVSANSEDRPARTMRAKRKQQLKKLKPAKPKIVRRS